MKYTKEEIDTAFKALPEPIQDAILSEDVNRSLQEIVQEYRLPVDAAGLACREAIYVLMGITSKEEYHTLLETLGLSKDQTEKLYIDIDKRVFEKVMRLFNTAAQAPAHTDDIGNSVPDVNKANPYDGTDPYHEQVG